MPTNHWFTGDWHLGHEAVIYYAHRPFSNVKEMDDTILDNCRNLIKKHDFLYINGDVSFYKPEKTVELLKTIPGHKVLAWGNHAKHLKLNQEFLKLFERIGDILELRIGDPDAKPKGSRFIVFCHYAFKTWNRSHHGSWNLHGHSHGSLADDPHALQLDVGVDCWNYRPVSYDEIKAKMATKVFVPIDHHGRGHAD